MNISPSTYTSPANVNYTNGDGSNVPVLYKDGGNGYYCETPDYTSGNLNTNCTPGIAGTNSFDGTEDGTYHLIQATMVDCRVGPLSYAQCNSANPGLAQATFTIGEPTYGPKAAVGNLGTAFTDTGTVLAVGLGAILIGIVSLLGLGYGVKTLYRTIFNYPGGFGYNSSMGSGISRWKKTNRPTITRF